MKNQFVTYEIALKLKELGFDEVCLAVYFKDKFQLVKGFNINNVDLHVANEFGGILAPLWQQVIDWCLAKLESFNIEPYNRRWSIVYYADGDGWIDFGEGDYYFEFKTLEQAILKMIELCQKRK